MARKSAKTRAYEFIKDAIATGVLPEGEFIVESQLAEQLGISRTPVREALQLLERAGFVRVIPKKGAYIPPIGVQEIWEVWEARRLVESYCVRHAAESRDPELPSQLHELLDQQRESALAQDVRKFIELDREFHRTLVGAAGNSVVSEFYESLRDRQLRMGVQALRGSTGRSQQVIEEHEAITEAIRRGDPDQAIAALCVHLDATRNAITRA